MFLRSIFLRSIFRGFQIGFKRCKGMCGSALIVNGRVKWQKALTSGIKKSRAGQWKKKAAKIDRDRVREMAEDSGEWILEEPSGGRISKGARG